MEELFVQRFLHRQLLLTPKPPSFWIPNYFKGEIVLAILWLTYTIGNIPN